MPMEVLVAGDTFASHSGGVGIVLDPPQIQAGDITKLSQEWEDWLEEIEF
jgi:hypothetical protein